jgi:CheY-like chemotaxis protein
MNVLVVDDEPMMRKMLKLALKKRGFEVFDAANGADALALAAKQPIDILVTDVVMEEMDGWALAELLTNRYADVPVVFISGYPIDFEDERPKYIPCRFLTKPFQPNELMEAILELVGVAAV